MAFCHTTRSRCDRAAFATQARLFVFLCPRSLLFECRQVAHLETELFGLEDATHDLAGAGLRQARAELDLLGHRDRADRLADVLAQGSDHLLVAAVAGAQRDEGLDRLAGDLVRLADHRSLSDRRVADQRAFDLTGTQPIARLADHVVDAPLDPEVPVLVAVSGVASKVDRLAVDLDRVPVRRVALRIAKDATHHGGPRAADDQVTAFIGADLVAVAVDDVGVDARQRQRGRPRLGRRDDRRRDHHHARLRLPPGIDYRAIAANLAVPHPGFRVDRLADGAEQAQGREVILPGPDFAKPHHRADRRWRGVEDRHVVALDQ